MITRWSFSVSEKDGRYFGAQAESYPNGQWVQYSNPSVRVTAADHSQQEQQLSDGEHRQSATGWTRILDRLAYCIFGNPSKRRRPPGRHRATVHQAEDL